MLHRLGALVHEEPHCTGLSNCQCGCPKFLFQYSSSIRQHDIGNVLGLYVYVCIYVYMYM